MQMRILAAAAVCAVLFTAPALAETPKPGETAAGPALVNAEGMTLYTFEKDAEGKSNCTGGCAQNWPPAEAAASDSESGDFSIITREDGTKQWAYKGMPLYTWVRDTKPGDATGGSVPNWNIATP